MNTLENQKLKIKNQMFNSKVKSWVNFSFLIAILNFAFLILNSRFAYAQNVVYPIPKLGNCSSSQECKLYCDLPYNQPTCWSYGKYVMNNDVLGDSTVIINDPATMNITYPIADLGNCASAQECFLYCTQPKNQEACVSYARKNGLVKDETDGSNNDINEQELVKSAQNELGCNSKDACMALCNDPVNRDKCRTFAQKHGFDKSDKHEERQEILEKAKSALGCDSREACSKFCQNPDNQDKCFEFAKENKLINEDDAQKIESIREKRKELLDAAKEELGCNSKESCYKICANPDNREKCSTLGRKFGMMKDEIKSQSNGGFGGINKSTLPCTSETECKSYCLSHPDECPGMSARPNLKASENSLLKPNTASHSPQKGDFLGPSGCRTEDECKSYCQKHPDLCPGFPKDNKQTVNPTSSPSSNTTSQTSEFPPDCSQSADCRARYCQKYPDRCTNLTGTDTIVTPTKSSEFPG